MKVKYRYVGGGACYYGIPARDLTKTDWDRLSEAQQALVAGSPLYEAREQGSKGARDSSGDQAPNKEA